MILIIFKMLHHIALNRVFVQLSISVLSQVSFNIYLSIPQADFYLCFRYLDFPVAYEIALILATSYLQLLCKCRFLHSLDLWE